MKKLFILFCLTIIYSMNLTAQNVDSLLIEDVKRLDKKINTLLYSLSKEEEQYKHTYDSLYKLHQVTLKKLNELNQIIVNENEGMRDSFSNDAKMINQEIKKNYKQNKVAFIIHYILFGFLVLLVLYLAIVLRISRRESIEYLLSQTDGLSQQSYEILEKAEELKKIKKNLKEIVKQQKEEEKKRKKSGKKRKK